MKKMSAKKLGRRLAIIGAGIAKRKLDEENGPYDRAFNTRLGQTLQNMDPMEKHFAELLLNSSSVVLDEHFSDHTPLRKFVASILDSVPANIAKRIKRTSGDQR